MADRMGTLKIKCSITTGGGPFARGPRTSVSFKKKQTQISHNLFNAVTFQAASTSLLLHLAGGAVAHPPAVGVAGGGRELHVLLVDPWGVLGSCERGHRIGKVKVSSNAKLALHCRRIWRCGCQERFFTGFLINSRQIRVNQGIKKLHYEFSIVRDLCLLRKWASKPP